jgi:hypothetical protein
VTSVVRDPVSYHGYESAEVGRAVSSGVVHASQIKALVGVCHDVTEAGCADETVGKRFVDHPARLEAAKGIPIARRRAGIQGQTCGHRQVDHNLRGLPQVEDDGVCGIGRGLRVRCRRR